MFVHTMRGSSYSRREYMMLGGVLTAGMFAGCTGSGAGDGGGNSSGGSSGSGGGNSSGGSGNAGVTVWTDAWDKDAPKAQSYIRDNTNAKVTFTDMRYDNIQQKFLTGAKTGTPDVVEGNPSQRGDYYSADLLEPLTDRVDELDYKDDYIGLDTMTYKGDTWALPYIGNGRGFVYRQDIMEEYGEVPDDWSKFLEIASSITKDKDGMHGFTLTSQKGNTRMLQEYLSFLFQRVDDVFKPDGDSWKLVPSAEDLGQVFKEYYWDPFYKHDPPASDPNARGIDSIAHDIAYANGNYAAISTGPWIPGVTQNSDNSNNQAMKNYRNSAVTHNPRIKNGEKGTYREVKPIFMNTFSENKNAAWEVIKAGTSKKGIRGYLDGYPGNLPALESVKWKVPEDTNNPDWAGFEEIFKSGTSYGFWSVSKVSSSFFDLSQAVMYDRTDPMDAGKQLHEQWTAKTSSI